jgi:hypothetical protein
MNENLTQTTGVEHDELLGYRNPRVSLEHRVADLLSRMTLEEKVAQMVCIWNHVRADAVGFAFTFNILKSLVNGLTIP